MSALNRKLSPGGALGSPSDDQYSMRPLASIEIIAERAAWNLIAITGAEWMETVRMSPASLEVSKRRMCGLSASATASSARDRLEPPPIHSHTLGANSNLTQLIISNDRTSKTLKALSAAVVASSEPSCVDAMHAIGAM